MIEIQGLRKSFNDIEVLRGVGVTVRDGKIHRLIGPNGTGKTTTMRMLYYGLTARRRPRPCRWL
jgi:ABC-type multidrug transport system ATPase subunit